MRSELKSVNSLLNMALAVASICKEMCIIKWFSLNKTGNICIT